MRIIMILLVTLINVNIAFTQGLFINELVASNFSTITDEDGEFSDWIELYNSSNTPISLWGYHLSDDTDDMYKWAFPDTVILPNEYLIVFASSKDRGILGSELHSNFKINSDGEELILSYLGTEIHVVPPISLSSDESYGLYPDGSSYFNLLSTTSPGYSNNASSIKQEISFSHEGGFYSNFFVLELIASSVEGGIYYTIDGSTPSINSFNYSAPVYIDENFFSPNNINQLQISPDGYYYPPSQNDVPKIVVIRAAIIDNFGDLLSDVVTHSYFIDSIGNHIPDLPIVSICGDTADFFDYNNGILVPGVHFNTNDPDWTGNYCQRGFDWERAVNMEFFENHINYVNQVCGLRAHGGNSRRFPQKGLKLYARSEYGKSNFNHHLFTNKNITEYKRLVLKPFSSSWSQAGIENQISSDLASSLNIDFVSSRPAVVYLNGEYWGIYYLQEKIDEHYIEENYSINEECVDMLDGWAGTPITGSNTEFLELYDFIENNYLEINANYEYVKEKIDIDNFIDYQLFEIFIANYDWPANNMKLWKSSCGNDKWRWIFFDGDGALGDYKFDAFSHALNTGVEPWPTNASSTLFLRKLLQNDDFHHLFFKRLEELLNDQLAYDSSEKIYLELLEKINNELQYQVNRFNYPTSLSLGISQIEGVNNFLLKRPCKISSQSNSDFSTSINIPKCEQECNNIYEIRTYPNPTSEKSHFSFYSEKASTAHLTISEISGEQIHLESVILIEGYNDLLIEDLASLNNGFYIITLFIDTCNYSSKLLVIR